MSIELVSHTSSTQTPLVSLSAAGKKKLSTRALVLITTVFIITCGFILTIGFLLWQSGQQQKNTAQQLLEQTAYTSAYSVQNRLDIALFAARDLAQSVTSLRETGAPDRATAELLLKNTLKSHPDLLSMSLAWEPNAFDGKDQQYASQPEQDPKGRFVRYVDRDNAGKVALHNLTDYETPGSGDYYLLPRKLQKEVILEPYSYPYNGVDVLLTSIAVPIMIDGKFYGSVTADFSLDTLQQMVNGIKPYQGAGYATMYSASGTYIAHPDKARIAKKLEGDPPLMDSIAAGKPYNRQRFNSFTNADMMNAYVPIAIGNTGTPWMLGVSVPEQVVMAESVRLRYIGALMTLLSILVVSGVIGLIFTRKVLRPVGGEPVEAAAIALAVAQGDLTLHIPVQPKDTSSIFYAMSEMQQQLRSIVEQLMSTSESVSHGAVEISAGNVDLASRTEQQAAALEETAASMEQITATVKQNADNAHSATRLTQNAAHIAQRGDEIVGQVVSVMGSIDESSKKISEITGIISSIAFQTNILALNAAVEAARAGEQGRGFAVVAGEVRSLAQRSADAVKDITALIGESAERVGHGVGMVESAGKTMRDMLTAVTSVNDIMSEIVAASDEQSRGISQVTQAVHEMDGVTQQNAALVQQATAAAASLEDQARQLAQLVQVFRIH
ncbi:methyl-accepting chemotaxis protein [Dickeya fangzhongdai]|uniref:methyl-accepting chemotaxis protein n=1 Tax=Dickeya fangzhongdai TaxID=1778540 RepID=UPI000EAF0B8E|nr:methyl-accepting chemotaxis protein [Dickeya fangzhongdai]AYH50038.1 chemotaxis protein [Dickeya fangzhongdai]ULR31034.1 methyl-accepting chemotaxis protein [Dickeya fangzhongdai]WES90109.1 methyl-accepting chemotaxis protein [Dickeya fangzhongdai]